MTSGGAGAGEGEGKGFHPAGGSKATVMVELWNFDKLCLSLLWLPLLNK